MILRQRVAWGKLYYDLRHVYCSDFAKNGTKYGHNFNQTLYVWRQYFSCTWATGGQGAWGEQTVRGGAHI